MPTKPATWKPEIPKHRIRENRQSRSKRGYDRRWYEWRGWFLRRHPLCEDCKREGRTTEAVDVHHVAKLVDRPDLKCVEDNCIALCKRCHAVRTGRGE